MALTLIDAPWLLPTEPDLFEIKTIFLEVVAPARIPTDWFWRSVADWGLVVAGVPEAPVSVAIAYVQRSYKSKVQTSETSMCAIKNIKKRRQNCTFGSLVYLQFRIWSPYNLIHKFGPPVL